jgi:predicted transcriptional regulator
MNCEKIYCLFVAGASIDELADMAKVDRAIIEKALRQYLDAKEKNKRG